MHIHTKHKHSGPEDIQVLLQTKLFDLKKDIIWPCGNSSRSEWPHFYRQPSAMC